VSTPPAEELVLLLVCLCALQRVEIKAAVEIHIAWVSRSFERRLERAFVAACPRMLGKCGFQKGSSKAGLRHFITTYTLLVVTSWLQFGVASGVKALIEQSREIPRRRKHSCFVHLPRRRTPVGGQARHSPAPSARLQERPPYDQLYNTERTRKSSAARCEVRQNANLLVDFTTVFHGHA